MSAAAENEEERLKPAPTRWPRIGPAYVELATATAFSFLRGASHPHEMVGQAWELGHAAAAVADINTLAGVVRAHNRAKDIWETLGLTREEGEAEGIKPFRFCVGARLSFMGGEPDVLVYPSNREAFGRLTRLLTKGGMEAGVKRGDGSSLAFEDLLDFAEGQNLILMPPDLPEAGALSGQLDRLLQASGGRTWMAGVRRYDAVDEARLDLCAEAAEHAGARLIAVNDAVIHEASRKRLHDVMTCIREHVTLYDAGRRLEANAERRLKSAAEMAVLFKPHPGAVEETARFAELCDFTLDELRYEYPDEPVPKDKTAQQHLRDLSWAGAKYRYGVNPSWPVKRQLVTELKFIREMKYENYFLTVHDIVAWARGEGILCQGRGSAANSIVCYALGVTAIDPIEHKLLFSRFISDNRREPPDIDVDFEHERRELVIQHIYERYGRHRAAICATVIHYRPRMAIREVGKVFGLTEDLTSSLASTVWGSWGDALPPEHVRQAGHDPNDHVLKEVLELANELISFPRHLSQHVGGFVLTQRPLSETCPIVNAAMPDRTFIEWDKDDIDAVGLMKVDVLALGMLTAIKKAFGLLEAEGVLYEHFDMAEIPPHLPDVYKMCAEGDTIGVFQIESRAQMNMLPRLRPEKFYDLVIEVAIVRPGPIQGDMVHPYLRRKSGLEPVTYPKRNGGDDSELREVLEKTLGVPLFQEQVMKVAMVAAEFTGAEADGLRRAMATFKKVGGMSRYRDKLIAGMTRRGYDEVFAQQIFKQIEGFGSYGFPESHAASFAKLVYVSAWLKCRFPAAFCAALLNSQPMGFYAPAQIVRDAHEHGVEVRPSDVEHSGWDCTLEYDDQGAMAVRLGLRLIDGLAKALGERIAALRGEGYGDFDSFMRRTQLTRAQVRRLAQADAFASFDMNRRGGLWQALKTAAKADAPLVDALPRYKPPPPLPLLSLSEEVVADYQTTRLSLKGHPMHFIRDVFAREGVRPCGDLLRMRDKDKASVAGVVLVRQRPGNGNVCFITIEDEGGVANLVVVMPVFEAHRGIIMSARLLVAHGHVQKSVEGVTHLFVDRLEDRSHELGRLTEQGEQAGQPVFQPAIAPADHVKTNGPTGSAGVRMSSLKAPDERSAQRLAAEQDDARRAKAYCSAKPGGKHPRDLRIISRDFH